MPYPNTSKCTCTVIFNAFLFTPWISDLYSNDFFRLHASGTFLISDKLVSVFEHHSVANYLSISPQVCFSIIKRFAQVIWFHLKITVTAFVFWIALKTMHWLCVSILCCNPMQWFLCILTSVDCTEHYQGPWIPIENRLRTKSAHKIASNYVKDDYRALLKVKLINTCW